MGGSGTQEEFAEWKDVIDEIDKDGNGEIGFEEFELMMKKLVADHAANRI